MPNETDKWVLSVICWKVENLSARFAPRRMEGDDDIWAVCQFALSGNLSFDWEPKYQETDTHYRWTFDVPPAYHARFAFPELKIQLRSHRKEREREAAAQKAFDEAKAEGDGKEKPMPNPKNLPPLDQSTAIAEGTLALHDLFTAADTNYKLK